MLEHLAKHKKILVTGPHRSGTTFAATAIQADLKDTHGLVREELCWLPKQRLERLRYWLQEFPEPVVVQAPFAADCCHQFPGTFVVFMVRDTNDISKSQQRMRLSPTSSRHVLRSVNPLALALTDKGGKPVPWLGIEITEREKYGDMDAPIAESKYASWIEQRERLVGYLELDYESLSAHPLWVSPDARKEFHVRQTHAVG